MWTATSTLGKFTYAGGYENILHAFGYKTEPEWLYLWLARWDLPCSMPSQKKLRQELISEMAKPLSPVKTAVSAMPRALSLHLTELLKTLSLLAVKSFWPITPIALVDYPDSLQTLCFFAFSNTLGARLMALLFDSFFFGVFARSFPASFGLSVQLLIGFCARFLLTSRWPVL